MRISRQLQTAGIAIGLGIFIAAALVATVGAKKAANDAPAPGGPISEAVIAPAEQLGKAYAAVAAHVKPAVVSVYSEKMVRMQSPEFDLPFGEDFFHQFFGDQSPEQPPNAPHQRKEFKVPERGMGTGMIIDREGHILTNYHVVADVDTIKVQLANQRTFDAKIIGADRKTDVAVLEMKGSIPRDLPTVEFGDSDALEDGYLVMAIGAPFGLTQTVTTGIISAKGRSDVGIADFEDFLQTDAPINPGNSGGPLINMRGQVVGMNSAIETEVGQFGGVGFAIPANMIKAMLPTLLKGEQVTRGMLGVSIQNVTKELAEQFHIAGEKGALIAQVTPHSPAEKAGLKAGDVIVRYNGQEVNDSTQLRNLIAATAPGTDVRLTIIRGGNEKAVAVTVGKLAAEKLPPARGSKGGGGNQLAALGLTVQTLDAEAARQFDIAETRGVLITGVEDGSLAADADLQPGDVIVEADHKPIASVGELQSVLGQDKSQILLLIKRGGGSVYLVFKIR